MTQNELILIERLIQKTVDAEILKIESKYKKELNEATQNVMKLAKMLKTVINEGKVPEKRKNSDKSFIEKSSNIQENKGTVRKVDRAIIRESLSNVPRVSYDSAMIMQKDGDLPDFDAPIFISEDSEVMRSLMDKLDG